ncbi:MMPL family transporter [Streptomyces gamaensis]|uniref:MMPL family transporter n=1 Tax=Streptomyces gamaensis TaxID=1763542 RepID=A0ABW0Z0J3_9ACTN
MTRSFALVVVRHRRWVISLWAVFLGAAALFLPGFTGTLAVPSFVMPDTESAQAGRIVQEGFPEFGAEQMIAVFRSPGLDAEDPLFRKTVDRASAALSAQPGIAGVSDLPVPSAGDTRHTAYRLVGVAGAPDRRQARSAAQQTALADTADRVSGHRVSADLLGLTAAVTQLQEKMAPSLRLADALAVTAACTALLLVLRRPVPAALPLLAAGTTVAVALALLGVVPGVSVDLFTAATTSALGLGVGLDYALLVLMRFREHRAEGADGQRAAVAAVLTAGRTVTYSALTVVAGAASLLVVGMPLVRSCALGAMAVTATALLAAVTLLPACLAQWPDAVTATRRPRTTGRNTDRAKRPGGWELWARQVMRRPWPCALAALAVLALASWPAAGLRTGFDFDRGALAGTPAGTALHTLETQGAAGAAATVVIALPHPGTQVPQELPALMNALATDPDIAAAVPVGNERGTTAVLVLPRSAIDAAPTASLVDRLRHHVLPSALPPGRRACVGGAPAALADQHTVVDDSLVTVAVCLLVGALCFLTVAFRSLLLPLKAIAANIAVTAATFGILRVCAPWLGTAGHPVINHYVPLVTVVMLFGLSLDYEMFLVRRVRERHLAGDDDTTAVAVALSRTATPITLAAAVMVAAFASFTTVGSAAVRQFGFAVAVAIALDATVVRLLLVPALMRLLGRWNWWLPGSGDRRHGERPVRAGADRPGALSGRP